MSIDATKPYNSVAGSLVPSAIRETRAEINALENKLDTHKQEIGERAAAIEQTAQQNLTTVNQKISSNESERDTRNLTDENNLKDLITEIESVPRDYPSDPADINTSLQGINGHAFKAFIEGDFKNVIDLLQTVINTTYGVGCFFTTVDSSIDPNGFSFLPASAIWELQENQILRGSPLSDQMILGSVQGSDNITLSVNNLPRHNHGVKLTDPGHTHSYKDQFWSEYGEDEDIDEESGHNNSYYNATKTTGNSKTGITLTENDVGGNQPFSKLPRHQKVFIWKRLA